MVVRGGKLAYAEAVGQRDPSQAAPMQVDDVVRIYSMTKPLTSVAAMMLVEQGKLNLDEPMASYIAAFANVKVGVETVAANGSKSLEIVNAQRPMTVRDLMRHDSGLTYGFVGTGLVKQAYRDARIGAAGNTSNAQFAEAIAKMPLAYPPGSTWDYSNSNDVLGRIVEVASGQSLGQFLKARLFEPLGMKDTRFYVPDSDRQARLAEPFPGDGVTANSPLFDPRVPKAMESGGGLISTAADYTRFLLMLRNGGQLDGKRYISQATL
jgi:CubicO group peptidase (beta-lactamase class C family)